MKCDVAMRHLGPVDIGPLHELLQRQPEELWSADLTFQKRLAPYRKTQTVYLLMTVGSVYAQSRQMAGWEPLHEAFEPVAARIAAFFPGTGRVLNAQLAMLGPGDDIPEHIDYGPVLEATHRVHVPLVTHPDVQFLVDGENIHLEVGQAYELDNLRPHSVLNLSPVRRIHLIVDYHDDTPRFAVGA